MNSKRVAENLIKTHGLKKFVRLVEMFQSNTPGSAIAAEFGVSRQRVNQWKQVLGREQVHFVLNPDVETLLGIISSARRTLI